MGKKAAKAAAKTKILIVEDDSAIAFGLQKNLEFEGYEAFVASRGDDGLTQALDQRPDLIILDIMLPKMNGYEICEELRKRHVEIPVIFLTAKVQERDKILGFDLGCDDYITKPFSVRELIARVKTVLRRARVEAAEPFCFGDVRVDFDSQQVWLRDEEVGLTSREFELLRFLIRSEGKVLTREVILNRVWGFNYYGTARTIDNFITRLRQKIGDDSERPRFIVTVRGVGYRFQPSSEE
jgi:two-component system alkaline phosphatase synthesis response regulator PhoP